MIDTFVVSGVEGPTGTSLREGNGQVMNMNTSTVELITPSGVSVSVGISRPGIGIAGSHRYRVDVGEFQQA